MELYQITDIDSDADVESKLEELIRRPNITKEMAYHLSDSDADSKFLGFTQSAISDKEDNLNDISDISDVELSASSSE